MQDLSDEARIVIAYAAPPIRSPLRTLFALDQRLGRIVAATSEPMLGQMRLAWWRDMLGSPAEKRPPGDTVLDAIGSDWRAQEAALVALVDGWEHLLAERLDPQVADKFADGRAAPFAALANMAHVPDAAPNSRRIGRRWALADAAAHVTLPEERAVLLELAGSDSAPAPVARPLRALAVLDALARRSIARGGRALTEGRGAAVAAARAAVIGR